MRHRKSIIALVAIASLALGVSAQRKKAVKLKAGKDHQLDVTIDGADGMRFVLHLPRGWKKKTKRVFPVLLTMHGNGGSASNMLGTFRPLSTKKSPLIILSLGYQKEQRSGGPLWPRAVIDGAIDWLFDRAVSEWRGDPGRLFVQGFSMGSGQASHYARHQADKKPKHRIRGVVLNSGFFTRGRFAWPEIPTLCIAGEQETNFNGTNYVESCNQCANLLFRRGIDARRHIIAGMGHAVNATCVELVRQLIFDECDSTKSLKKDVQHLKKRWRKHTHRYTALRRAKRRLEGLDTGAKRDAIAKLIATLEADPLFVSEREAWEGLKTAREADKPGSPDRRAAYETLAKSYPKTEAGRLAKNRLDWMD